MEAKQTNKSIRDIKFCNDGLSLVLRECKIVGSSPARTIRVLFEKVGKRWKEVVNCQNWLKEEHLSFRDAFSSVSNCLFVNSNSH